ncbi:MAG: hypothetical protein R3B06_26560 [Kofleriaceae bacterium]
MRIRHLLVGALISSVGVAPVAAEPDRPGPVVVGGGVSYAVLDPGGAAYLPSTLAGVMPAAYVGWRPRPDLEASADAWLSYGTDDDYRARAWGAAAGVGYASPWSAVVTLRLGYGHVEWGDSDGGYLDRDDVVLGVGARVELYRDRLGALVALGAISRTTAWLSDDGQPAQTLYAVGLGFER